jgi:uncharacterized coiled-coil protein SlyX
MSEMTPLQARAVLEQIRDRNVAINSINDVLKCHDEALAALKGFDAQSAEKEATIASLDRAEGEKRAQVDALKVEIASLTKELRDRRADALAKVTEESDKRFEKLQADAIKKIEKGLQDFIADTERKKAQVQEAAEQEKTRLDLEIADKQSRLDSLTAKLKQQIANLQNAI